MGNQNCKQIQIQKTSYLGIGNGQLTLNDNQFQTDDIISKNINNPLESFMKKSSKKITFASNHLCQYAQNTSKQQNQQVNSSEQQATFVTKKKKNQTDFFLKQNQTSLEYRDNNLKKKDSKKTLKSPKFKTSNFDEIEISQQKLVHIRQENIENYYQMEQLVGKGAYGSVYLAKLKKNQEIRAIKQIKKQGTYRGKKSNVFTQLQILKKLNHPNIIKLYQVFENPNQYYIVMEYCKGGSIIDFIKNRKIFNQNIVKNIIKQLLSCLVYMHKKKIVHRDLKLENVVFLKSVGQNNQDNNVDIKLLDFGTSYILERPKIKINDLVGTLSYIAPQIIKGYFTEKCDLWSLGVIMYILLTSNSPFKSKDKNDTIHKILTQETSFAEKKWKNVSQNAIDLLSKLLKKDPYQRLSAKEALNHPWFIDNTQEINNLKSANYLLNMTNYYRNNNLISTLESYLVFTKISQEERLKISQIFKQFDKNNDGTIQKQELIDVYQSNSIQMDEIQDIINRLDKDKSGQIDLNEFTSAMIDKQRLFTRNFLSQAFQYFDLDGTGFIQKQELTSLLKGCDNHQIQCIISELDEDEDEKISKDEFMNYLLKKGFLFQ